MSTGSYNKMENKQLNIVEMALKEVKEREQLKQVKEIIEKDRELLKGLGK